MTTSTQVTNLYENTGPQQVTTTTILLVLASVFVGFRFWARYLVGAIYGLDDWVIVAGLAATFVIGGLNYGMVAHGLGRHAALIPQSEQTIFYKLLLAFECLYVVAVALVKISILAMYVRIFPSRGFGVAAWLLGSLTVAWAIAIALVCIFQCSPVHVAWMPWLAGVDGSTCINLRLSFIGNAVPNIMTDIAIMIMPIRQVWKLHATWAQKVSLVCTFLLGSFVLIASIYRFSTLMAFDIMDTTFTLATACTWCVVEVACAVICACLPTLRPLARKVSSQFGSSSYLLSKSRHAQHKLPPSHPTELVTIGGHVYSDRRGTDSQLVNKSPFRRLGSADDDDGKGVGHMYAQREEDDEDDVVGVGRPSENNGGSSGGAVVVTTEILQTRTAASTSSSSLVVEVAAEGGQVVTSSSSLDKGHASFV